ncbi:MAG: 2-hydroxyacyl-CoA dehydratase family protein [Desulfobacterales bacterium]|nr:2-hydroxyacyl-CoA dehydratase family protein [Desulfobacterales bacterium]
MRKKIGFTCAYTPVPLIEAAGFSPFRVLPDTAAPDQSGHLLHDNMCPHVKKVLDRALAEDLPELAGMVFINSCDAMRRLADAWQDARPGDRVILLDLPSGRRPMDVEFLGREYARLGRALGEWAGQPRDAEAEADRLRNAVADWNRLAGKVRGIRDAMAEDFVPGLAARLQDLVNTVAARGTGAALEAACRPLPGPDSGAGPQARVFVFGNLLYDPGIYDLFESWNIHVAGSDFCTGARFVPRIDLPPDSDLFTALAAAYLDRMPCARTMDTDRPGDIARSVLDMARQSRARGVVGFTVKFCDPYLARIPMIREELKQASVPFLFLEGDCTAGAMGQQQTRIEAFTEMLEGRE